MRYARAVGVLYLAALIVGAGTLLLQLFGSGDADAGQDLDHAAADADADADAGGGHAHGVSGFVPIFLSLRFWTFGLLAFGLVLRFAFIDESLAAAPHVVLRGASPAHPPRGGSLDFWAEASRGRGEAA